MPTINANISPRFFAGKMENFLTCRAVAAYLKNINILDESAGKFFEELALKAIFKTLSAGMTFADARLFISDISNILALNYPIVENIRNSVIKIISQMKEVLRLSIQGVPHFHLWNDIVELENIQVLINVFVDTPHA